MFKLKLAAKKENVRIVLISAVLSALLLVFAWNPGFLRNLSDFFCNLGLILVIVGGSRYVRNVGLFKSFSYLGYRHRWKTSGALNGETHPMSLADYTQNIIYDDARQKAVGWPLLSGVGCMTASFLLVFVC